MLASFEVGKSALAPLTLTPSGEGATMLDERAPVKLPIAATIGVTKGAARVFVETSSVAMPNSGLSPLPLRIPINSTQELVMPAVILTFGISMLRIMPLSSPMTSSLSVIIS